MWNDWHSAWHLLRHQNMLVFCRRGRLPPPLSSVSLSPSQHDRQNLAKANRDSSNFFTCFGCFGLQNSTTHFSQALTPKPSEYLHCVHHTSLSQGKCWFMYFSLLLCGYKCNKNIWYLSLIAVKNMGYSMFLTALHSVSLSVWAKEIPIHSSTHRRG